MPGRSAVATRGRRRRRGGGGTAAAAATMTTVTLALCAGRAAAASSARMPSPTTAAAFATTASSRGAAGSLEACQVDGKALPCQRWRRASSSSSLPPRIGRGRNASRDLDRRNTALAPLRMATDSRELRFFAGAPATGRSSPTNGDSVSAPHQFLGDILSVEDAADKVEFTSALSSTTVFASSAFRGKHQEEMAGASAATATESLTASVRQSFSRSFGHGLASSVTACFSASSTVAASSTATLAPAVMSSSASDMSEEGRRSERGGANGSSGSPNGTRGPKVTHTIDLSDEERELFKLLTQVVQETHLTSTLRVAGGWVRDKLLATDEFRQRRRLLEGEEDDEDVHLERLTSKFKSKQEGVASHQAHSPHPPPVGSQPSAGRQGTKLVGRSSSASKPAAMSSKKRSSDLPEGVQSVALLNNGAAAADDDDEENSFDHSHPVDIDVALDDMLGREFADKLNDWLSEHGRDRAPVGVVLKNPEKSKHLETATMKVGDFWIDFVNLRAEEYTSDSRIPDLMRIGTAEEDAHRRDLTINALFYNVNTGRVEDWTGRGFDDLRRGVVATPLPPLTTLLDDPLRVLRAVRFAARLRFDMDDDLRESARDVRVREALGLKVARERVGSEVDLMLRSPDPVGAMRLLVSLRLVDTVFPASEAVPDEQTRAGVFARGLTLLSATHDHLLDCKARPPLWCERKRALAARSYGAEESTLIDDEESRRLLWYASFLKPFRDVTDKVRDQLDEEEKKKKGARSRGKKANRSAVTRLLVDEIKRPLRDAEAVERIQKAADEFTALMDAGADAISTAVLAGEVTVRFDVDEECGVEYFVDPNGDCYSVTCEMRREDADEYYNEDEFGSMVSSLPLVVNGDGCDESEFEHKYDFGAKVVDSVTETDPLWKRAMAFRLLASKVLAKVGPLWRAALVLSLSERLARTYDDELGQAMEGDYMDQSYSESRRNLVARYDAFAAALQQLGLIGIWSQKPLIDGLEMKGTVLKAVPKGPVFRDIMAEQERWMTTHPGGGKSALIRHMRETFPEFVGEEKEEAAEKKGSDGR